MEQRKAAVLLKQQAQADTGTVTDATTSQTDGKDAKKAAVAAASQEQSEKAAAQGETVATYVTGKCGRKTDETSTAIDPKSRSSCSHCKG